VEFDHWTPEPLDQLIRFQEYDLGTPTALQGMASVLGAFQQLRLTFVGSEDVRLQRVTQVLGAFGADHFAQANRR
jgi:hypothetical protein